MKIQTIRGKFDETCTVKNNLTENGAKFPQIRDVMQYAERRQITTLLTSGVRSAYEAEDPAGGKRDKFKTIPADKLIGDSGYRYQIQGRIQQPSTINGTAPVSVSSDGQTFVLSIKDNYLTPNMVARFYTGFHGVVQGEPTGGDGDYHYTFKSVNGTAFDWATHVGVQSGTKTCFGSYTMFSNKSTTGYSRSHYPDEYINHTTIERKTIGIDGSTAMDVLWVQYNGVKGWFWLKEAQAKAQLKMENEYKLWEGESTLKAADGSLLTVPRMRDSQTGEYIWAGDGIIPQIDGINEAYGSGTDGNYTLDDITDLMTTLQMRSDATDGLMWYGITGTQGMKRIQELLSTQAQNFNITINQDGSNAIGGPEVTVGYNFNTYNVNGNQVCFIVHPLFDDFERYPQKDSEGKYLKSSEIIFLEAGMKQGQSNIECIAKGAFGGSRKEVTEYLNGLTGVKLGKVVSGVDALEAHWLKEDMIVIYNTRACGRLRKSA